MHESLHKLEGLIRLLPEMAARVSPGDIKILLDEARQALLDNALTLTEDKALRVLVRGYQDRLTGLSDEVYKDLQTHGVSHAHIYDPLLDVLSRLLTFLKEDFGEFTNPERKIPDVERVRVQSMLGEQWARIGAVLPLETDRAVREHLDRWFTVLLDGRYTPFLNERQYVYHRVLINEFLDRIPEEEDADLPGDYPLFSPLVESLVYMNFNHPAILGRLTGNWSRSLRAGAGEMQASSIRHWQALLAKMPVQKTYALYLGKRTLREQLEQWLGNQLECAVYRGNKPTYPSYPSYPDEPLATGIIREAYENYNQGVTAAVKTGKMQLAISVAALALFVRLLVEHKIIRGLPQTEIMQFFVLHFSTARQAEVSAGSMYGSYHKPVHSTVVMLRQCLKEWDRIAAKWE